jgi:hypothetical protein
VGDGWQFLSHLVGRYVFSVGGKTFRRPSQGYVPRECVPSGFSGEALALGTKGQVSFGNLTKQIQNIQGSFGNAALPGVRMKSKITVHDCAATVIGSLEDSDSSNPSFMNDYGM